MSEIKLVISGSRTYNDRKRFNELMAQWILANGRPDLIISGREPNGVDAMAEAYAVENSIPFLPFPADWTKFGKAAGPMRNQAMVDSGTHVLALPSKQGRGTQDTMRRAQKAQKPLTVVEID